MTWNEVFHAKSYKKFDLGKAVGLVGKGGGSVANPNHYLVCSQSSDTLSSFVRLWELTLPKRKKELVLKVIQQYANLILKIRWRVWTSI